MFAVDDIDDVVGRLRARGFELVAEVARTRTAIGSATSAAPGIIVALAEELS
jgi:hypothetical protein